MSSQAILNSHNTWFDLLSYTKLNELFQRATYDVINRRKLLQVHINNELRNKTNYYSTVDLETTYIHNGIKKDICSIYINIHDRHTDEPVAHFTLHFFKHRETTQQSIGRIHFQNKTNSKHVIRINKNTENTVKMTITSYPNTPSKILEEVYSIIIDIMSLYTKNGNPLFLGIPLTSMTINSIEHPCIKLTEQEWKTSKTPLRHTRKVNYASRKHIRRNKKHLP